jgi:hypothetical protein
MIKKLRNQPYAPKVEQAPKWEQEEVKKNLIRSPYDSFNRGSANRKASTYTQGNTKAE